MTIIKKFEEIADFYNYAHQHPATINTWQKNGPLSWKRILVAKTDRHDAVIFSATLLERICAWVADLFGTSGSFYAKKLKADKVTLLPPCSLKEIDEKARLLALKSVFKPLNFPKPGQPAAPKGNVAGNAQGNAGRNAQGNAGGNVAGQAQGNVAGNAGNNPQIALPAGGQPPPHAPVIGQPLLPQQPPIAPGNVPQVFPALLLLT